MILYHTTSERNLESILSRGLLLAKATGAARRVWGCKAFKVKWARKHVSTRHLWKNKELVTLELAVPDDWLTRFADGVFWCDRDIPPAHIMAVRFSDSANLPSH